MQDSFGLVSPEVCLFVFFYVEQSEAHSLSTFQNVFLQILYIL